ncbi:MAG: cytochrome c3 family protein [Thermodesulfobacteriota bacterium]|nr:cytochrome c3 family protein [Thermodesulfobacteriota bacterium]
MSTDMKNMEKGVIIMRRAGMFKTSCLAVLLSVFLALVPVGYALATVTGACVNCHTMHNSQGGTEMQLKAGETDPQGNLVRGTCVGCHGSDPAGASNIVTNIPQVWHSDGNDLAGGNFKYVVDTGDAYGHNVEGVVAADGTLTNTPPGYAAAMDPASTDYATASRLTCAGQNGCHGNRDNSGNYAGVSGAHHGSDAVLKFGGIVEGSQGASVATSYRFLYKVQGGEDTDWQDTVGAADHNEYKGAIYAARTTMAWADVNTISELCAECHGSFHMSGATGIGTASPWTRHPTDVLIPNSGEYASISTTYNPTVPVGRTTIPNAASGTVAAGTDIVTCLSCHRAHASGYADILRWDYSTMIANGGSLSTGCFVCHTTKDDGS